MISKESKNKILNGHLVDHKWPIQVIFLADRRPTNSCAYATVLRLSVVVVCL